MNLQGSAFRFVILRVMPDKVLSMTLRDLQAKRWTKGRLIIIRYPLVSERLVGLLFTRGQYPGPTVELMTGRSNYVFRVDSK